MPDDEKQLRPNPFAGDPRLSEDISGLPPPGTPFWQRLTGSWITNSSTAEQREHAYVELRQFITQLHLDSRVVEAYLRESLQDAPDWLQAMVLDDFGYDIRRPGLPPRSRDNLTRR